MRNLIFAYLICLGRHHRQPRPSGQTPPRILDVGDRTQPAHRLRRRRQDRQDRPQKRNHVEGRGHQVGLSQ